MCIIEALEVDSVDPDDSSFLFYFEVEHRPRNGADKSGVTAAAFPPLFGYAAVVKQGG